MRRVLPIPVSAAFAFFVRSLSVHSYTPMMRVPAFDASAVRRSRSVVLLERLEREEQRQQHDGREVHERDRHNGVAAAGDRPPCRRPVRSAKYTNSARTLGEQRRR